MQMNMLAKGWGRSSTYKKSDGELPENLQYLAMYVLGLLKTLVISPPNRILAPCDTVDSISYLKFVANSMGPQELLPLTHPQIFEISSDSL